MGLCRYYLGEVNIPNEKRQTYAEQALKLLRAGGMMSVKRINLYGRKLQLLYPPEWNEDGCATGNYNYYEDAYWDNGTMPLNYKDEIVLWSNDLQSPTTAEMAIRKIYR